MALEYDGTVRNVWVNDYKINRLVNDGKDFYDADRPGDYLRQAYGGRYWDAVRNFFILPLLNESPIVGVLAQDAPGGSSVGRGAGKTYFAAEQSKTVNRDGGASLLDEY